MPFVLSRDRVASSEAYRWLVSTHGRRAPTCPSIRPLDTPLARLLDGYSGRTEEGRAGCLATARSPSSAAPASTVRSRSGR
jgi:hypothetical protein